MKTIFILLPLYNDWKSLGELIKKVKIKVKQKIISNLKVDVTTYKYNQLPESLKSIPITTPGSRFIK